MPSQPRHSIQPAEAAIATFTSKQRAHLRALAHDLKPAVHVGKEGVTIAAIRSAREAFNTRELLKVRVLEAAPVTAREAGETLVGSIEDASVVVTVGRTVILYRPHPEKPAIQLPQG